jgi:hypothetical protein
MAQNYLVIGTVRSGAESHESITHLIYYTPEDSEHQHVAIADAIKKIDNKEAYYFTHEGGKSVNVRVVDKKYVRTSPDGTLKDNLLNLPIYSFKK